MAVKNAKAANMCKNCKHTVGRTVPRRKTLMIVSRLRIQKWQSCTNGFKIREFLLNLLRQIKV